MKFNNLTTNKIQSYEKYVHMENIQYLSSLVRPVKNPEHYISAKILIHFTEHPIENFERS